MTVARDVASASEEVIQRDAGPDVAAIEPAGRERQQDRDRVGEVWAQALEQEGALAECLAHQLHPALLEVAEATVEQLAGAARGPGGEVARLDERDVQTAGRRVERHTAT